ncbi:hypothetical protein E2I00_012660, partial [Balaenoptera physalus]
MTRHGKNCTAGAVYTYHEKKKDTGTGVGRGDKWTLNPDGYLYEREAILEYILHQKKEIARQMKPGDLRDGAGLGCGFLFGAGPLIIVPHRHPHCSGAVVTVECVEKLIRKDMVDPVTGEKLTDRDIIVLQR